MLPRLGQADSQLERIIFSKRFAERRAQDFCGHDMTWADGCATLEHLALGLKVSEVCASDSMNHLYFQYGGGLNILEETKKLIHAAALFMQYHPRLKLQVDAHAGVGAPHGIATSTSRRRANAVAEELTELGVPKEHITTRAWGRRVSAVWSEPESNAAARAELYFSLDGKEFPERPEYYRVAKDQAGNKSDFSDSDDDRPFFHRQDRMLAMLRALGYPVHGAFQGSNGTVTFLARRGNSEADSDAPEPDSDVPTEHAEVEELLPDSAEPLDSDDEP